MDLEALPPRRLDIPVLRGVRPGIEVRANGDGMPHLTGHFSVFGAWYEVNSFWEGHFMERVAAGAFKKTFAERGDQIRVLLEHGHDPQVGDKPLGVHEALREDDDGAFYDVRLFDTPYVRALIPALEAGQYGASFRFQVPEGKDTWVDDPGRSEHNPQGIPERTIHETVTFEYGPTVFPASPTTTAGLRSSSLTDRYYEELRARNPRQHDDLLRRAHDLRTPAAPGTGAANATDEPASRHSEGPTHRSRREALFPFLMEEAS